MKFQDMMGLSSYYFNFKGGKEMISYYELLGMIKDKCNPERVVYGNAIYEYRGGNYYSDKEIMYLSEMFSEIDSFEKVIEIIEDKKLKKLKIENNHIIGKWKNGSDYCYTLSAPQTVLANKINEIIEVINEEKEIQDNQE